MGKGQRASRAGRYGFANKLRRRFSKLLIALGLIYLGAALATATQNQTPSPAPQQFTTYSSSAHPDTNQAILSQATQAAPHPTDTAAQAFIPQCTYQAIPYKTVYKTASWLEVGQTVSTGGLDGEEKICSAQSGPPTITTIISPLDKTISSGTYQPINYQGYTNANGNYISSPTYSGEVVGGSSPTAP